MVRGCVSLAGALLAGGGLIGLGFGQPGGWGPLVFGALILISLLLEQRYRRDHARPMGPGWAETAEIFRDEESGRPMRVWANTETGERRYVEITPTPDG